MSIDFNRLSELAVQWLQTDGLVLGRNIVVFLVVLVAGYFTARIARGAVGSAIDRAKIDPSPLFRQFVVNVSGKSIWLIALVVALGNLGIDTSALIAGIGVSGLVLGFALKDTLSNFASGMLILMYQPFDVGHFVEISNTQGKVEDLTLVSTILTTPDNKTVNFPNSEVWGNPITNFSVSGTRRIDLVIGVAYDTDIDHARRVFFDVLDETDMVLEDPEPVVMLADLNDSSVDFHVRGWVETPEFFPTRSDLIRRCKYRLDEEGIGIPFPQREIWMHEMADGPDETQTAAAGEPAAV